MATKPKMAQAIRKGIRIQNYKYSENPKSAYHWSYVLRAKSKPKRKLIAEAARKAVATGKIFYSNEAAKNAVFFDAMKILQWDFSKLHRKVTTNCCNFVSVCCNYAGLKTPRKSSARTMASKWKKYGFNCYRFTGKNLQVGDILVDNTEPKVHTAIYLG